MDRNIGIIDRFVRFVIATLIVVSYGMSWVRGIAGPILAGLLLSSVASGHDSLYEKLGIKTTV